MSEVRLVRRRKIAENTVFDIFFDHIRSAAGSEVENFLVVSPRIKSESGYTGVAVLPILGDKLGLLRVYRHAVRQELWEIPRGLIDPGEDKERAAVRELEEETGLVAQSSHLSYLGTILPEPGVIDAKVAVFSVEVKAGPAAPAQEEIGILSFRFFSRGEVLELLKSGEVCDPYTVFAICRFMIS